MPVEFLKGSERETLATIAALADGNPFLPERIDNERRILGSAYVETGRVWHADGDSREWGPNVMRLVAVAEEFAERLRTRLARGARPDDTQALQYEALVRLVVYQRNLQVLGELLDRPRPLTTDEWGKVANDLGTFVDAGELRFPFRTDAASIFAWGYQIRRAFHHIYRQIFGGSLPSARLRAVTWQSIFTHDARRYRSSLFDRMGDITTLIVGESGTGKELVARAIALSRWIPFDPQRRAFAHDGGTPFFPVNLTALSPTLIESELFGHRRGAFTGAVENRTGWLEACPALGTVFVDEVGDLDPNIQVKLLRVLQERTFQRIGETESRRFDGKIVAATNRDLDELMRGGRFRRDFYYRLCADVIHTPPLREQLADRPEDLANLVVILGRRIVADTEVDRLTDEVCTWVREHLGPEYPWPGNVRELEQCIRNVLIRREYRPPSLKDLGGDDDLALSLRNLALSADDLVTLYCVRAYDQLGSYVAVASRLGLDRRTVRQRVEKARRKEH